MAPNTTTGEARGCAWQRRTGVVLIGDVPFGQSRARVLTVRSRAPSKDNPAIQDLVMRYLSGPEEFRNRESVTLAVQGTRNLKQLAGAELYLHRVARQRAGHPPGEYEVNMLAMRNVVGSVLYAGGSIRPQDDTLGDVLGELYWTKEIDLGCRFDPASRELSIGAVGARVRSSGGTEVELQGGQSAPVSMGCYTATLTIAQAYRSNGVGAPKYDVEFSLVSDLIIEN